MQTCNKKIEHSYCLYVRIMCGDAVGRKNDHSGADFQFAETIGIKCIVPEDLFVLKKTKGKSRGSNKTASANQRPKIIIPNHQEVIVLVGQEHPVRYRVRIIFHSAWRRIQDICQDDQGSKAKT
jgi:hypothetical protein